MDDLHYKIAEITDFEDFYKLKSEPGNIFWSGFTEAPDYDGFKDLYKQWLTREDRTIIFLYINDDIAGYVTISFCDVDNTVETAHGVLKDFSGRGLGKELIRYAVDYAQLEIPEADNIIGWIAESNIGSIKNVLVNGYTTTEEFEFRTFQQVEYKVRFNKYIKSLK